MASFLVENGADVNIQARDGVTAFEMATILGELGCFCELFVYCGEQCVMVSSCTFPASN